MFASRTRAEGQLLRPQDLSKQVQNSANRALLAVDWPPTAAHTGGQTAAQRPHQLTNGEASGVTHQHRPHGEKSCRTLDFLW